MGYHRAGWDVVGVDKYPQPNYPFEFHQADALTFLTDNWREFDAAHASCPCQPFSVMSSCRPGLAASYDDLIAPMREILLSVGIPYVMENVPRAPLRADLTLCGQMFGLELYRHRIFETSFPVRPMKHTRHAIPASRAGHWRPGTIMSISGHFSPMAKAREIMGIDWMGRDELAEAIPPAYATFVGAQLLDHIELRSIL